MKNVEKKDITQYTQYIAIQYPIDVLSTLYRHYNGAQAFLKSWQEHCRFRNISIHFLWRSWVENQTSPALESLKRVQRCSQYCVVSWTYWSDKLRWHPLSLPFF